MATLRAGWVSGAVAAGVALAPAATAHDWLVNSNPAAGATITNAPAQIRLSFNDRVLTKPAGPEVIITGPGGKHYETGCATSIGSDVSVTWKPGEAGQYRVEWRIVSADGHPVSNAITFTYDGKSEGNPGKSSQSSCATTTDTASSMGGSQLPVLLAVGAVGVTAAAIIWMTARSRRKEN